LTKRIVSGEESVRPDEFAFGRKDRCHFGRIAAGGGGAVGANGRIADSRRTVTGVSRSAKHEAGAPEQ
jgi:hypothetical protein